MQTLLTVVHVITCVLIILVVLLQSGKGAEISSSFAGSSQTVFGSSGGANFFTRFTGGAAAVFFVTSLVLTITGSDSRKSLFDSMAGTPPPAKAAAPQGAPAKSTGEAPKNEPAQSAPAAGTEKKN